MQPLITDLQSPSVVVDFWVEGVEYAPAHGSVTTVTILLEIHPLFTEWLWEEG